MFTQEEIELLWKGLDALVTDEHSERLIEPIKEKLDRLASLNAWMWMEDLWDAFQKEKG